MSSAEHDAQVTDLGSADPGAGAVPEAASRLASAAGSSPAPTPDEAPAPADAPSPPEEQEQDRGDQAAEAEAAALDPELAAEREFDALAARAEQADAYLDLAQRTKAEFENYRKRAMREAALAQERGVIKLARELLPAVDSLDRALEAAEMTGGEAPEAGQNGAAQLVSGIKLVHADVIAALARMGIEPFSPLGEPFDPQHHEAVAQQPVDDAEPGTIIEVYQRGFRLGESILRPARVVVAA